jgi:hypothetical protein
MANKILIILQDGSLFINRSILAVVSSLMIKNLEVFFASKKQKIAIF